MSNSSTEITIAGEGPALAGYVSTPSGGVRRGSPAVVLIHGFPSMARPGPPSQSYHHLAERISSELRITALAVSLRGCGDSAGDFSLRGWIDDVCRAVDHLDDRVGRVSLVGSTTGGSLAVLAAPEIERVSGVAAVAARADFDDWALEPLRILEHCRRVKVIKDPDQPASLDVWADELETYRPVDAAARMGDKSLMVIHGGSDRQVPASDSRALAEAHGHAELRILEGADHRVRHDPRCVAVLLGWLDRQAN